MAKINNHLVIMAGGVGSRFWPMSTPEKPKQFIDVLGIGKSLLQLTVERFDTIVPAENVWVVINKNYAAIVAEQLPDIPADHILCEPCRRNTAPCIAYVSWRIKSKDPKANIVVSPSNKEIFRVDSFREKPDLKTAKKYIAKSNYFWNAGIFIWNVATIVNAFRIYQPSMAKIFESLLPVYGTPQEQEKIDQLFPECENISVDYGIMEKAEEIFVCPADFGWSDLGTWGSLQQQTKKDLYGNACIGDDINVFETHNCIIHTTQEKKVVVQGLDGFIVAENDNTLLICKLSEEQRIKQFSGQS